MSSIPVYEAKTRLSELLTQVQHGEEFVITRHGVPVARLVPPAAPAAEPEAARDTQRRRVQGAFAGLAALREHVTLGVPLKQALADGRD